MAFSTSATALWTILSSRADRPSLRLPPSAFGMYTRSTGFGQYCPLWTRSCSRWRLSSRFCSYSSTVTLSTPGLAARRCRLNARLSASTSTWCNNAVNRAWPSRLATAFTRRRWGSKGCQRCVWPFAASCGFLSSRPLFSVTSLPSATSSIVWAGPTSDRDTASGDGLPFPDAPAGDQPADPAGSLRFRYQPCARDLLLAPGGVAALSHTESGHAAFAGAISSSASTTCPFRDSIHRPHAPAVYASDPALPRRLQDSLLVCLLDFDQAGLSPTS